MKLNDGERHLFEFERGMSGSFFQNLFQAIFKADMTNLARLSLAFPEEVKAVRRFQNEDGYWDLIQSSYEKNES